MKLHKILIFNLLIFAIQFIAIAQTDITSLNDITDADGQYRINSDISGGTPGVTIFNGTLEAAIDPATHMPYRINGLTAPLFTTLTGTVKNLVLEDVAISGNTGNTGAIACTASGDNARIYNVGILSGSVGGPGTTTMFGGQRIETTVANALNYIKNNLGGYGSTVYDNAVVLVGNLHLDGVPSGGSDPFTMMSVDEDDDHEPDYCLICHHKDRVAIAPIRFDFLPVTGTAQAQKPNTASLICNFTIVKTKGWFECTNTAHFYTSEFEYENLASVTKADAPLILLGGIIDQFVSTQNQNVTGKTIYIHVGGNAWIYEFGMGTHSDGNKSTPHVPVSVTGGEFPGFYLTGTYRADAAARTDNAECYISGGYIHEAAGAALEQINGNVRWQTRLEATQK